MARTLANAFQLVVFTVLGVLPGALCAVFALVAYNAFFAPASELGGALSSIYLTVFAGAVVGGFAGFVGGLWSLGYFKNRRTKRTKSNHSTTNNKFECLRCGATIVATELSCQNCGWTWNVGDS